MIRVASAREPHPAETGALRDRCEEVDSRACAAVTYENLEELRLAVRTEDRRPVESLSVIDLVTLADGGHTIAADGDLSLHHSSQGGGQVSRAVAVHELISPQHRAGREASVASSLPAVPKLIGSTRSSSAWRLRPSSPSPPRLDDGRLLAGGWDRFAQSRLDAARSLAEHAADWDESDDDDVKRWT